jgi:hypothetical protein
MVNGALPMNGAPATQFGPHCGGRMVARRTVRVRMPRILVKFPSIDRKNQTTAKTGLLSVSASFGCNAAAKSRRGEGQDHVVSDTRRILAQHRHHAAAD